MQLDPSSRDRARDGFWLPGERVGMSFEQLSSKGGVVGNESVDDSRPPWCSRPAGAVARAVEAKEPYQSVEPDQIVKPGEKGRCSVDILPEFEVGIIPVDAERNVSSFLRQVVRVSVC